MLAVMVLILCMVIAGLLGGLVNLAMDQETKPNWFSDLSLVDFPWRAYFREAAISVAAAFLTPLFLSMTDSPLVADFVGTASKPIAMPDPASGALFFGFCLVAALTSKRFIQTVSDSILKRVNDAETKANDAASKANTASEKADDAKSKADDASSKATDAADKALQAEGKANDAAGLARDVAMENADPELVAEMNPAVVLESVALEEPNAPLTGSQRQLLKAFQDHLNRYHFRSIGGLARGARLHEAAVKHDLEALSHRTPPLVQRRDSLGPAAWSLTPAGRTIKVN